MQTILSLVLIGVIFSGIVLISKWKKLFGKSSDEPSETAGARSYGIAHLIAIYLISIICLIYLKTVL